MSEHGYMDLHVEQDTPVTSEHYGATEHVPSGWTVLLIGTHASTSGVRIFVGDEAREFLRRLRDEVDAALARLPVAAERPVLAGEPIAPGETRG